VGLQRAVRKKQRLTWGSLTFAPAFLGSAGCKHRNHASLTYAAVVPTRGARVRGQRGTEEGGNVPTNLLLLLLGNQGIEGLIEGGAHSVGLFVAEVTNNEL